ncbi:MAG: hypothetical protein IJ867_06580 [Clostridia bacterium]|nr:hypothetical protein [Clostridia bacterium]
MAEGVSKQQLKNYLDKEKEVSDKLKDAMFPGKNWGDFKNELCSSIESYSKKPTRETRSAIDAVIDKYSDNIFACKDAVDEIFLGLGISRETPYKEQLKEMFGETGNKENKSSSRESFEEQARKLFEKLEIDFPKDVVAESNRKIEELHRQRYGIKRNIAKPNPEKAPKIKKEGKIRTAIINLARKAYYKATASIIMAPGKVPPEVLSENREMLENASGKLDKLIEELETANGISFRANEDLEVGKNLPVVLKASYLLLRKDQLDEDELSQFETELKNRSRQQLASIRGTFSCLQRGNLDEELMALAENELVDLSRGEIENEIKLVFSNIKVNNEGNLVLPKNSIFKSIILDENGKIAPNHLEIAEKLTIYAEAPKVADLSKSELERLAKNFRDIDKLNPDSKEYAVAQFLHSHPLSVSSGGNKEIEENAYLKYIENTYLDYTAVKSAREEAEFKHKLMVSREIRGQFDQIQDIIREYDEKEKVNGSLSKDDSKKREIALKIARKKVASLEKAGLSKVITDGEKKHRAIMKDARRILLPQLENARDRGTKNLDKEFEKPEDFEIVD